MAYLVFVVLMALAWQLSRQPELRRQAGWLAGLTLLQIATGLSNVVLGWPLVAAAAHTGGAAALVVVLTAIIFSVRRLFAGRPQASLNASRLTV